MPHASIFGRDIRAFRLRRFGRQLRRVGVPEQLEDRTLLSPTVTLLKQHDYHDDEIPMPTSIGLFFGIDSGTDDPDQLWITDGTTAGTLKLRDFEYLEPYPIRGSLFAEFNGEMYFGASGTASDSTTGLWKSDGTIAGTVQVLTMHRPPVGFLVVNDKLIFYASTPDAGNELWVSDGTANGTQLIKDIFPGSGSSIDPYTPQSIVMNDKVYFAAESSPKNLELWSSDGTAEGTQLVKDILPGGESSPSSFTVVGNRLVFEALGPGGLSSPLNHYSLWSTDGTAEGTIELKHLENLIPGTTATLLKRPEILGTYNGEVYFQPETDDPQSNEELWATDGTLAGTRFVKDLTPGAEYDWISSFAESNGRIYFSANDGTHGQQELWVSDGTTAGTRLVKDINPRHRYDGFPNDSTPRNFFPFGGQTVFSAEDGKKGFELWTTDGTEAGTVQVVDIVRGRNSSFPYPFATVGNALLFFASTDGYGNLFRLTLGDDPQEPEGPQILPQTFTLAENSPAQSAFGVVVATGAGKLTYSITGGDPDGNFSIDARTGELTVQNPVGLDFETSPRFSLTVRVVSSKSGSAIETITIDLSDRNEPIVLQVAGTPLSAASKSAPVAIDPQAAIVVEGAPPNAFEGASLVVSIGQGFQSKDQLGLLAGTGPNALHLKGKALLRGSTVVATVSGGKGKQGPLRIQFLPAATLADVTATLRQVSFTTKGTSGDRLVALQLLSVHGLNSPAASRLLKIN